MQDMLGMALKKQTPDQVIKSLGARDGRSPMSLIVSLSYDDSDDEDCWSVDLSDSPIPRRTPAFTIATRIIEGQ